MRHSFAIRYALIAIFLSIVFLFLQAALDALDHGVALNLFPSDFGWDGLFLSTTPIMLGLLGYIVGRQRDRLVMQRRYVEVLNQIMINLTRSLNLDQALVRALELSSEALELDGGSLYLFERDHLILRASTSGVSAILSEVVQRIQVEQWLPLLLPRNSGQQLSTIDLEKDLQELAEVRQAGYRWLTSVLILSEMQPVGLMLIISRQDQHLLSEQQTFLAAVANQIGAALDNARSFTEVRRRARDMEAIGEVNRKLLANVDLDKMLNMIVNAAQVRFGLPYVAVLWVDEAAGDFVIRSAAGPLAVSNQIGYRQKLTEGLSAQVYQTGEFHLARDVRTEPDYVSAFHGPVMSSLLMPMRIGQRVIGVMAFDSLALDGFSDEDVAALKTLTDQVTIAAENARLYTIAERERRRIAAILHNTADAVILIDPVGVVQLINPAAERIFGVQADAAIGQPMDQIINLPPVLKAYREAMEYPSEEARPTFEVTLSGSAYYRVSLTSVRDEAGVLLGQVVGMQDISDLKQLDQLRTQMVQMASHDLRNPLGVASGYLDLLEENLAPLTPMREKLLSGLRHALERMRNLVTDLLSVEQVESEADRVRVGIKLDEMLEQITTDFYEQATAKGQTLELKVESGAPVITGDPVRLKQAFSNLVGNAIKYTPDEGHIWVRLNGNGQHLICEVQDNGYGIPRESQPNLFKRFYRAKAPGTEHIEGTGLGLSLVKAVIEQHGGHISVDSDPGHGSTFRVELPIKQ